ncbi:hypothetical protein V2J09_016245 [Rumex salicifolius]
MANWVLWLVFLALTNSISVIFADELTLVVGNSTALQIVPGVPVMNSPGSKSGLIVGAERVHIHGLSRVKSVQKFSHSFKVKVTIVNSTIRQPVIEVCFHRNVSLGIAMCPQGQWEKLSKGSWVWTMSPYDHKLLDIRMAGTPQPLEISITEEFFAYRLVFLVFGTLLLMFAPSWSKSLVFYYSSAMGVGIILVILMVLFQGMKLIPTGRHSSFLIVIYSSLVGAGSFFLTYLPKLLHTLLAEIGIAEDVFNPLAIFLFLFIALAGAWLGFWAVRKLVLAEDGTIDASVCQFVEWAIRVVAAFMVLQCSLDPLLAAGAFLLSILISSVLHRATRLRSIRHIFKKLLGKSKNSQQKYVNHSSPSIDTHRNYNDRVHGSGVPSSEDAFQLSDSENFYSTFHEVPRRKEFNKDEWDNFTRNSTKKALQELVSSPDFNRWAVANAERITLSPRNNTRRNKNGNGGFRRWLFPFN